MGSAVLTNSLGGNVSEFQPTRNFDGNARFHLQTSGGVNKIGYLYFSRPFPLGATIISAKIKMNSVAMTTGTHTINLQRLNVGWSASKVTWNTRPTSLIAGVKGVTKSGVLAELVEWEWDVADWMQTIANGGVNHGMQITCTEAVERLLYSDNAPETAYRPRLEITWSDAPSTPTGMSPSGGRAVGLAKPVVRATYLDVSGSTSLQGINVQINATDSWGAPTFDSGTVLTSVPELDLNTTAYAGLADGSTTFWRVRLQDAAGIWSAWSAAASFKRDDKGALSVSNPPSGTPKVEDTTPPIIWTFTGETQSAYQIQITHLANGVQVLDWDSGKVTSAATSITVPSGKITEVGSTFTVAVRIWDTEQREATPGDTTYVELTRAFTFTPGATTGTTGLTAVPDATRPKVVLTWQAATAPDFFNVLRNGKVIDGGLLPAPLFVSGTTYTYTDYSPSPGRSLTYSVQRVVGTVASATNATAVATVNSKGIWLRDPTSGIDLVLMDANDREFTLGETSAVLQSIAANANKVPINQSLGGLEGRIEGQLVDIFGKTAQEWRDRYLQLRAMRVKKFWLTVGEATFLAVCQEFTYTQRGIPVPTFRVSFMAYQQDSLDKTLPLGS